MGIKERHERDREAVRRAILDAARELFVTEGYQQVSIRKIAERIEYSPAAIYSYFPGKDDIFFALAEERFRLLAANVEALKPLEPLERLRAIFWNVYAFSSAHPQYFTLMFVDRSVPRIIREYERFSFARDNKQFIVDTIQQCIDAKVLPSTLSPLIAFHLLVIAVFGAAAIRLSDRGPTAIADELARDAISVVIAGMQADVDLTARTAPLGASEEPETSEIGVVK